MTGTCWADPLTRAERAALARKLANAAQRFGNAPDPGRRKLLGVSPADARMARRMASAEMSDLHLDATERAAVPA